MKRLAAILAAIWLITAVLPAACHRHRQQPQQPSAADAVMPVVAAHSPSAVTVHDTIIQYVADSTYAREIREQYEQSLLASLRELVKMDSVVVLLWDGISVFADENQAAGKKAARLQAEVVALQQRLSSMLAPAPSYSEVLASADEPAAKTASRRIHSQWLLEQPRTIYTVGADDEVREVEVTGSSTYENEIYLAVEIGGESAGEVAAYMNGETSPYQHIKNSERVFVFALPKLTGTVKLEFVVDGRSYTVKTSIKNLI